GGASSRAHQVEAERPVGGIDERLRRDGADARLRPRHARPDGKGMGLDGDAQLARRRVARDDGERVDGAQWNSSISGEERGDVQEESERSGGEAVHGSSFGGTIAGAFEAPPSSFEGPPRKLGLGLLSGQAVQGPESPDQVSRMDAHYLAVPEQ